MFSGEFELTDDACFLALTWIKIVSTRRLITVRSLEFLKSVMLRVATLHLRRRRSEIIKAFISAWMIGLNRTMPFRLGLVMVLWGDEILLDMSNNLLGSLRVLIRSRLMDLIMAPKNRIG